MDWLFFALLAPLMYTFVIFIDKYIVGHAVSDYWGLPIYSTIAGAVFGTFFWALGDFHGLPRSDALIILLSGALTIWGAVLYFKAISEEESSIIIMMLQMQPLMVLGLSVIFLRDVISGAQLAGFSLILAAAVALAVAKAEQPGKSFKLSTAFWLILVADLMWAVGVILYKAVSPDNPFILTVAYESWGLGLGGALLYVFVPRIRNAFHTTVRESRRAFWMILVNESLFVAAKLIALQAIALGPVALVTVIGGTQVFYGVLLGAVLTLLLPKVYSEDLRGRTLVKKGVWALVMFAGLWLVQ